MKTMATQLALLIRSGRKKKDPIIFMIGSLVQAVFNRQ
jgi:hypothetical protein